PGTARRDRGIPDGSRVTSSSIAAVGLACPQREQAALLHPRRPTPSQPPNGTIAQASKPGREPMSEPQETALDRRDLLGAVGAAAALAADHAFAAGPGGKVEDRTSSIRLTFSQHTAERTGRPESPTGLLGPS